MQNLALPNVAHCVRNVRLSCRSPTDAISRDIALDKFQSGLSILQHLHNITNSPKAIGYASPCLKSFGRTAI